MKIGYFLCFPLAGLCQAAADQGKHQLAAVKLCDTSTANTAATSSIADSSVVCRAEAGIAPGRLCVASSWSIVLTGLVLPCRVVFTHQGNIGVVPGGKSSGGVVSQ